MQKTIERDDLNYNFLKKIIIRIDYNGILERELEKSIEKLKNHLLRNEFTKFNEGTINEVDFQIKDPQQIETQLFIPIQELRKTKSYNFSNTNDTVVVQISKFFMTISVDYEQYRKFEEFCTLFNDIFEVIQEDNNYIRVLRLGLRKINNCILLDLNRINEVIKEKYFSNLNGLFPEKIQVPILNKQNIDTFIYDDKNINLVRYLSSGVLEMNGEQKEAYQFVLDIDTYKNDEENIKENIIEDNGIYIQLIEFNNILFKAYINILNDNFIDTLVSGDIDNTLVLGVEKNDKI